MAQGSLKVKANKPAGKKNSAKAKKNNAAVKKGPKSIAPKKVKAQEVHKLKKAIKNKIHQNIESELAQRAQQCEEGKAFNYVQAPASSSGAAKGKKGKK